MAEARKELIGGRRNHHRLSGKWKTTWTRVSFPKRSIKTAVISAAKADAKVQSFLEGKEIVKEIYVPRQIGKPRRQGLKLLQNVPLSARQF